MENVTFLQGLINFGMYFGLSVVFLIVFKIIYTRLTPHDEWALIKEGKNTAASLALGGAVIGFAIAISGVIKNSVSIIDFSLWASVALLAQLLAFAIVRFVFMPKVVIRIENDETSAGVIVASISIAIGCLNAACMTY
jgi:putative membrane protein